MTDTQRDRIIRLRASGVNSNEVARRVGCLRRDVNKVMREHVRRCGR